MNTVSGLSLEKLAEPIRPALEAYAEQSDGAVVFDLDGATKLELTPDKPNSARSATPVEHLGEVAGTLYVIVFASEDGTGDESAYKLDDSMLGGGYPLLPKVVPRSKAGTHSEGHLSIATFFPYADEEPIMFANHLNLVSFKEGRLAQLAHLGQDRYDYVQATFRNTAAEPTATFTVGHNQETGERFGDPHSVFNKEFLVQIAGFLAITDDNVAKHYEALQALDVKEPILHF
jgi:hypothetical protein